jgi:predicted HicB family RNase H-like nuclease
MFKIPKEDNTITKTFRLPINLMEKMEKFAQNNNISLNRLVKECLIYAMDNIEKPIEKNNIENGE